MQVTRSRPLVVMVLASIAFAPASGCFPLGVDTVPLEDGCPVPAGGGQDCVTDRECDAGMTCQVSDPAAGGCGECVASRCASDADCGQLRATCALERALCVAPACELDGDECEASGTCVSTADGGLCEQTSAAARCTLLPANAVFVEGLDVELDLVVEDADGFLIAPATTDVAVVFAGAVNPVPGMVVAPRARGIAVRPSCGAATCRGSVSVQVGSATCEASIVVLPALDPGAARVVVVAEEDETPLAGVSVSLRDDVGTAAVGETDAAGVVQVTADALPGTLVSVTARINGRRARTLVHPGTRDLEVRLSRRRRPALMAGAVGSIDPTHMTPPGDVKVGSAGLPLSDLEEGLTGALLFGSPRRGLLDIDGLDLIPFQAFNGGTLSIGAEDVLPTFAVEGTPGRKVVWSFIGAARIAEVGPIVATYNQGGLSSTWPIIELMRVVDERATFGLSAHVNATMVQRPEDPNDYVNAGLAAAGTTRPDVFSGARISLVTPLLPAAHEGVLLLALAHIPGQGAVPLGARYLEDSDGDDLFDDDLLPVAGPHALFFAPPARGLVGRPLTFAAIAIDRAVLEQGILGDSRLFITPGQVEDGAELSIGAAFPAAPVLEVAGSVVTVPPVPLDTEVRALFVGADSEHELVFLAAATADLPSVDLAAIDPALGAATLVSERASQLVVDSRAGARGERLRATRLRATAATR